MGYAERVDKCNSNSSKDASKTDSYKSSGGNSGSGSKSGSSGNKDAYKYNNMVKNDRDKFNNLHHCWKLSPYSWFFPKENNLFYDLV